MSDSQFFKVFATLIGALVALTVVLFFIAQIVAGSGKQKVAADESQKVAERIKPVGTLAVSATPIMDTLIPVAKADSNKGKATYDASCAACHGSGVAGAPKLGDKAAWKDRIGQGTATLETHAIKGYQGKAGMMPAKGGNASLKDEDVKAAVAFMVEKSK